MLLRTQYLRAGGSFGGDAPPGVMPPRQRECGDSAGFRAAGHSTVMPPSGDNASAAAGARRFCGLPGGGPPGGGSFGGDDPSGRRKISKRKVGGHRKSRYLCTPDFRKMPGPPGRAAARGQWRRSTVGNDGPAVGSGWQRHNAADGFGCFGTQTAPPTCSDGGSNGRREQTGCSAVRLAHLLWEQGVAGSNPVSPTIDNQPLATTQVVFYWGRRHTIYTQNRGFSGCIRIGPRKSRIFRLH